MHIPDGMLPPLVTISAFALTAGAIAFALRAINQLPDPRRGIPRAALFTAAFFILSTVHIPIPPASVHLVLSGIMGVMLGYYAMPAIAIAIFLQAVMLGHGGLTTIGANALIMGVPALITCQIYRIAERRNVLATPWASRVSVFLVGVLGSTLAVLLFAITVISFLPAHIDANVERAALATMMLLHTPVILLEGFFCVWLVRYFHRIEPDILRGMHQP